MVSIIIPYYKKKKFIKETLDSVYNQTYKNYEVILIYNDKNKDDFNFVKSHLKKFPRYTIIKNSKLGAGISRNLGIKISKGKFLAFLDSDDLWRKDKLKKQLDSYNHLIPNMELYASKQRLILLGYLTTLQHQPLLYQTTSPNTLHLGLLILRLFFCFWGLLTMDSTIFQDLPLF